MDKMKIVEEKYLNKKLPAFGIGDTVKVLIKILEGDKVRLHPFEGIVIAKKDRGLRSSFTVRKVSYGEGIERVFPAHSPIIEKIEVIKKGKVKRARLYYLRKRIGKRATEVASAADTTEKKESSKQ